MFVLSHTHTHTHTHTHVKHTQRAGWSQVSCASWYFYLTSLCCLQTSGSSYSPVPALTAADGASQSHFQGLLGAPLGVSLKCWTCFWLQSKNKHVLIRGVLAAYESSVQTDNSWLIYSNMDTRLIITAGLFCGLRLVWVVTGTGLRYWRVW